MAKPNKAYPYGGAPYGSDNCKASNFTAPAADVAIVHMLERLNFFKVNSLKGCIGPQTEKPDRRYLPCHTDLSKFSNRQWLTDTISRISDMSLFTSSSQDRPISTIEMCVNGMEPLSNAFENRLHRYALGVVYFQIESMLTHSDKLLLKDGITLGDIYSDSDCIEKFRAAIVDTLLAVGMDIGTIEEGIETQNSKWKLHTLLIACSNIFGIGIEEIDVSSEWFGKFKTYMDYMYYCQHQKSVDQYGRSLIDRTVPEYEEAEACRKYLEGLYSENQPAKKNPYRSKIKTLPEKPAVSTAD